MEGAGEVAARLVEAGVAGPPPMPGVYAFCDAAGDLLFARAAPGPLFSSRDRRAPA